uniref:Protein kinase domain-containing protein n=1 Tax=Acrobeloides nanus TaxID=290746 RepID=A0A914DKS6_9BILA
MSDYKGTKDWTSPEVEKYVTNGKTFVGTSSDIYTLGLIFYYFLTDGDKAAGFKKYKSNLWDGLPKLNINKRTDFFDDVILKMLSDEPKNRPTASELNSNTLLNQYIQDETLEIEKEEVTNIPDYDSDTDYNSDKTLSEDETTTLIKTVKSEPITEYLTTESKSSTEQKKFNNLTADSGFIEKCDQITESTSMVSNISLTDSSMSNTTEFDLTQKISGDDKAVSFTYEKLLFDNQITEYKNIVNKYEHSHSRKIVAIKFVNVPLKRQPRTPIKDKQSKKIEQEYNDEMSQPGVVASILERYNR